MQGRRTGGGRPPATTTDASATTSATTDASATGDATAIVTTSATAGATARRGAARGLAVAAAVVAVATTADVLAGGPLRHLDTWLFADGLPPRTGPWHWFWRTLVNAGQYWLVGTLTALAVLAAARRARDVWTAVRGGLWLLSTEIIVRGAQIAFGRTPPRTGHDLLFQDGYLSYPSGHAANAAACWLVITALTGAARRWRIAAHALAATVAVAVVALGYHWATDALAGWALGTLLGTAGRALIPARTPPAPTAPAR
ncbi:phosphatase PAP2 family protein [Actinomadura parmotrematis]|uniref:Phosphatase PAP2 family protein n=1 Tax=Actinomadura parmotrematis TaxID=2864039 RepID=A0ABS7FRZ6_9ACTN|nr:phosphatase PAP2 family protein [Actinomadura parmotrematis]MBW8482745.1 phosphatase PAP2 family protein [Actinomadura parmotrematis]